MKENNMVFLSYARENKDIAERLYMNLRQSEINVWLDTKCLRPGANWQLEITKAIKEARYYILLISKHSINKRGYVQKEIKKALDLLEEFPRNQIFIIPVRLDNTQPIDEELLNLNWIDLYKDYRAGLEKILSALVDLLPEPLIFADTDQSKMKVLTTKTKVIHKGEEVDFDSTLMVGDERGSINYSPFVTIDEYFMQFIDRMPPSTTFANTSISYYFTINTKHPDLIIGDDLLIQYPERIILVFQITYKDIKVGLEFFTVMLSFNSEWRLVKIPYSSIIKISVPEIGLSIKRD